MGSRRLLSFSGVLFVVLVVVDAVALGGNTPDTGASGDKIASFYDAHQVQQTAGLFLLAAAVPLLVVFAGALAARLSPEGSLRRSVWPLVLLVGSGIAGAAVIVAAFVHLALVDGADKNLSAVSLQALNVLDADSWVAFNAGFGVMMLGAAGTLIPHQGGYRWFGWIAALLGVALFIPYADFVGLLGTLVWIVVLSLVLLRSTEAEYAAAPQAA